MTPERPYGWIWGTAIGGLVLASTSTDAQIQIGFTSLPPENGIVNAHTAQGDFNNDGWPDVLLAERFSTHRIALMHNEGHGRFRQINGRLPADIPPNWKGGGQSFADYDNDGDLDLFIAIGRWWHSQRGRNLLLRNDRGFFVDVAQAAGLVDVQATDNAVWLDYDRDGLLDLYTGNIGDRAARNLLYRNQGEGAFADVTSAAGLDLVLNDSDSGGGSNGGMVAGDFNNDGWPDLYLGVFDAENRLFFNTTRGAFTEATSVEIADPGEAFGTAVGDYDNDGDLDIFQATGGLRRLNRALFLVNVDAGIFLDATEGTGIVLNGNVETTGFADLDNDGFLDLTVGSPARFFINNGQGGFNDLTEQIAAGKDLSPPVVFADYNLDGAVDGYSWDAFQINNAPGTHWLQVELVGIQSNRNGIGARIFATTGSMRQMREILGGRGYDQDELAAHFGLGASTQVDLLEVHWPSGQVDRIVDIAADQRVRVFEGQGRVHRAEPTVWTGTDPDQVVLDGSDFSLTATVQSALYAPDAEIASITADLSALGGAAAFPLTDLGDGRFGLDVQWTIQSPNGIRPLDVLIEQQTRFGPHWIRLSGAVAVWPAKDRAILADPPDGWAISSVDEVGIEAQATDAAFAGQTGLALTTPSFWRIDFQPPQPVSTMGFKSLHLAFHPGDATAPRAASFSALINGKVIHLARRPPVAGVALEMDRRQWQVVEIPLDWFGVEQIESLRLSGNLEGRFLLDDIRLVSAALNGASTAVVELSDQTQPQGAALEQNYPNPFNRSTTIRFAVPEDGKVRLAVYNLAGQQVAILVDGERAAGAYAMQWDGRDDQGRELASGVYLYRLMAGGYKHTRKLLLVR